MNKEVIALALSRLFGCDNFTIPANLSQFLCRSPGTGLSIRPLTPVIIGIGIVIVIFIVRILLLLSINYYHYCIFYRHSGNIPDLRRSETTGCRFVLLESGRSDKSVPHNVLACLLLMSLHECLRPACVVRACVGSGPHLAPGTWHQTANQRVRGKKRMDVLLYTWADYPCRDRTLMWFDSLNERRSRLLRLSQHRHRHKHRHRLTTSAQKSFSVPDMPLNKVINGFR